jgi:hypothetical protein
MFDISEKAHKVACNFATVNASRVPPGKHILDIDIKKKFEELKKNPMGIHRLINDIANLADGDDTDNIAAEYYPKWGVDDFKALLELMEKE